MKFDELVKGFGEKIGVQLEMTDGAVTLDVDGMAITIQEIVELDSIAILGDIGEPPPEGLEQLLSAMLNANHLFQGTGGSTLSRDPETGRFFLCRCDALASTDIDRFTAIMEKFVNVLETWRKVIADYRPVEDSATEPSDEAPTFGAQGFMQI